MALHRLLIADDERPVREGLLAFDWAGVGFEAVGSAANGEEALERLKVEPVEVLLTDIKMPFLDGIELCRRAKTLYPGMKMILLTGHKEFEYAMAAIRLGVTEYLLKPVNLDELRQLFLMLKAELDDQNEANPPSAASEAPESGLIPVVQAVLEGHADQACRRFRDLLTPVLPAAVPPRLDYLRLRAMHSLARIGSFVSSKIDPLPGAPQPDFSPANLEGVTADELWSQAFDYLNRLTEDCRPAPHSLAWAYVQRALTYLHKNLGAKIALTQVAETVGLNESYFSQMFKKETGVNFVDYLRDLRMARAIDLMRTTDLRIFQIAAAVGYDDAAYFAGTFRRCTGHTPLEFRRRQNAMEESS